jgi:hypothetical protein
LQEFRCCVVSVTMHYGTRPSAVDLCLIYRFKDTTGNTKLRWEYNIEMELKVWGSVDVDWDSYAVECVLCELSSVFSNKQ